MSQKIFSYKKNDMGKSQKIVIKIGTSTLTQGTPNLSRRHMLELVRQIAYLHENGFQIVLVSSGSIAAGREVLNQPKVDRSLPEKQMLSAVGQVYLMHLWKELFNIYQIPVGQLLLTRGDFAERQGYLNARNTLDSLLHHRVLPIVNENDSVATREIYFGDNDNLAALVANLIAADLLILLTDQEGLFTADPTQDKNARLIEVVKTIDDQVFDLAGKTRKTKGMGSGGMYTKVEAAKFASQSGTPTVIASSAGPRILLDLAEGKKCGTLFLTDTTPLESRKRWLLSEKTQGSIKVDDGALHKLRDEGASLLAAGISEIQSRFERGSVVAINSTTGKPLAVGIVSYCSDDIAKIKSKHSSEIEQLLGYSYGLEVIHRDNMSLLR